MTLEELGAALRAEREQRGLSIEDAANHLKIGARLLRALEAGDTSSLPHLAYTKGFIRSYSAYVGLSAEEVGAALATLEANSEEAAPHAARQLPHCWLPVLPEPRPPLRRKGPHRRNRNG